MNDANDPSESMASKGGRAAAAKLTPEQRSERARKAAESRWLKNVPRATHSGQLELAGHTMACVVLEDGRRVLGTVSFMQAIGRTGNLRNATETETEDGSSFKTPPFLLADSLKPFVEKYLPDASATPIAYRSSRGTIAYGYEASLLPVVCRIYLDARRAKVLNNRQKHVAEACEILLSALASVGIDALVDEATGFQYSRTRDALQRLLEQYVSRELARWERTFEPDFYRHLYRLKNWAFNPASSKRTPQVARLTVNLTYDRIHPDLLKELKQVRSEGHKPNSKLHQWLTTGPSGGHPRLKQHLEGVVALMSVATSWDQFEEWVDRRYPQYNETMRLPFREDNDEPQSGD